MSGERDFRRLLEQKKGQRDHVQKERSRVESEIERKHQQSINCDEAQAIIQNIAQLTQQELEFHISELVSLAMAAVWEDPYALSVEFIQRRNRTECDLAFVRNDKKIDPMSASGGGAVDVASFALRTAAWSLSFPRTRNVLILDEPLKWLKGEDLPEKGAQMISEIAAQLKIQIIMISHIPDQVESADRVHRVSLRNGISAVC